MPSRVALVSTFQPETHYARFLLDGFRSEELATRYEVRGWTSVSETLPEGYAGTILPTWHPGVRFAYDLGRATRARSPDLVHFQHEFNMYGGPLSALAFPLALRAVRRAGPPCVCTVHAVIPPGVVDRAFMRQFGLAGMPPALFRAALGWIYRGIARWSDAVVVHSLSLRRTLLEHYGARPGQVLVMPHGSPAPCPPQTEAPSGPARLVCFGYLVPRKRIETLLHALALVRQSVPAELQFVGGESNPTYGARLRDLARSLGIADQVQFLGFMPWQSATGGPSALQLLRQADVFVIPGAMSHWASGPLALARALALPVVAPDIGVFREEVADGEDGLLYDPSSPASCAEALLRMLRDLGLRQAMWAASRQVALARAWPTIARRTADLYAQLDA